MSGCNVQLIGPSDRCIVELKNKETYAKRTARLLQVRKQSVRNAKIMRDLYAAKRSELCQNLTQKIQNDINDHWQRELSIKYADHEKLSTEVGKAHRTANRTIESQAIPRPVDATRENERFSKAIAVLREANQLHNNQLVESRSRQAGVRAVEDRRAAQVASLPPAPSPPYDLELAAAQVRQDRLNYNTSNHPPPPRSVKPRRQPSQASNRPMSKRADINQNNVPCASSVNSHGGVSRRPPEVVGDHEIVRIPKAKQVESQKDDEALPVPAVSDLRALVDLDDVLDDGDHSSDVQQRYETLVSRITRKRHLATVVADRANAPQYPTTQQYVAECVVSGVVDSSAGMEHASEVSHPTQLVDMNTNHGCYTQKPPHASPRLPPDNNNTKPQPVVARASFGFSGNGDSDYKPTATTRRVWSHPVVAPKRPTLPSLEPLLTRLGRLMTDADPYSDWSSGHKFCLPVATQTDDHGIETNIPSTEFQGDDKLSSELTKPLTQHLEQVLDRINRGLDRMEERVEHNDGQQHVVVKVDTSSQVSPKLRRHGSRSSLDLADGIPAGNNCGSTTPVSAPRNEVSPTQNSLDKPRVTGTEPAAQVPSYSVPELSKRQLIQRRLSHGLSTKRVKQLTALIHAQVTLSSKPATADDSAGGQTCDDSSLAASTTSWQSAASRNSIRLQAFPTTDEEESDDKENKSQQPPIPVFTSPEQSSPVQLARATYIPASWSKDETEDSSCCLGCAVVDSSLNAVGAVGSPPGPLFSTPMSVKTNCCLPASLDQLLSTCQPLVSVTRPLPSHVVTTSFADITQDGSLCQPRSQLALYSAVSSCSSQLLEGPLSSVGSGPTVVERYDTCRECVEKQAHELAQSILHQVSTENKSEQIAFDVSKSNNHPTDFPESLSSPSAPSDEEVKRASLKSALTSSLIQSVLSQVQSDMASKSSTSELLCRLLNSLNGSGSFPDDTLVSRGRQLLVSTGSLSTSQSDRSQRSPVNAGIPLQFSDATSKATSIECQNRDRGSATVACEQEPEQEVVLRYTTDDRDTLDELTLSIDVEDEESASPQSCAGGGGQSQRPLTSDLGSRLDENNNNTGLAMEAASPILNPTTQWLTNLVYSRRCSPDSQIHFVELRRFDETTTGTSRCSTENSSSPLNFAIPEPLAPSVSISPSPCYNKSLTVTQFKQLPQFEPYDESSSLDSEPTSSLSITSANSTPAFHKLHSIAIVVNKPSDNSTDSDYPGASDYGDDEDLTTLHRLRAHWPKTPLSSLPTLTYDSGRSGEEYASAASGVVPTPVLKLVTTPENSYGIGSPCDEAKLCRTDESPRTDSQQSAASHAMEVKVCDAAVVVDRDVSSSYGESQSVIPINQCFSHSAPASPGLGDCAQGSLAEEETVLFAGSSCTLLQGGPFKTVTVEDDDDFLSESGVEMPVTDSAISTQIVTSVSISPDRDPLPVSSTEPPYTATDETPRLVTSPCQLSYLHHLAYHDTCIPIDCHSGASSSRDTHISSQPSDSPVHGPLSSEIPSPVQSQLETSLIDSHTTATTTTPRDSCRITPPIAQSLRSMTRWRSTESTTSINGPSLVTSSGIPSTTASSFCNDNNSLVNSISTTVTPRDSNRVPLSLNQYLRNKDNWQDNKFQPATATSRLPPTSPLRVSLYHRMHCREDTTLVKERTSVMATSLYQAPSSSTHTPITHRDSTMSTTQLVPMESVSSLLCHQDSRDIESTTMQEAGSDANYEKERQKKLDAILGTPPVMLIVQPVSENQTVVSVEQQPRKRYHTRGRWKQKATLPSTGIRSKPQTISNRLSNQTTISSINRASNPSGATGVTSSNKSSSDCRSPAVRPRPCSPQIDTSPVKYHDPGRDATSQLLTAASNDPNSSQASSWRGMSVPLPVTLSARLAALGSAVSSGSQGSVGTHVAGGDSLGPRGSEYRLSRACPTGKPSTTTASLVSIDSPKLVGVGFHSRPALDRKEVALRSRMRVKQFDQICRQRLEADRQKQEHRVTSVVIPAPSRNSRIRGAGSTSRHPPERSQRR